MNRIPVLHVPLRSMIKARTLRANLNVRSLKVLSFRIFPFAHFEFVSDFELWISNFQIPSQVHGLDSRSNFEGVLFP